MRVSDLGEFGLIGRIAGLLPSPPADVVVGIGDDVAVLDTGGPEYLLATCDVQVENVHFSRGLTSPYQLGRKIVAINVSDIAAMGGSPCWALASLALPPETEVSFIDALYQGMQEQIAEAGAAIVGGNMSRIKDELVVDFFLMGKAAPEHLVLRRGAREGDLILVTGSLGDSRAGLEWLTHPQLSVTSQASRLVQERHLTPQPRLREGHLLARTGMVHAMADVSDGLLGDLQHICRASRVGAEILTDTLPVSPQCREVALAAGASGLDWALAGGEDYELLFTASAESVPEIQNILESETGTKAHVIGRIIEEGQGAQLVSAGGERTPFSRGAGGWDHFNSARSVRTRETKQTDKEKTRERGE